MRSVFTFIHRAVLVFIFGLCCVSVFGEEAALSEQIQAQLKAAEDIKKSGDSEGAKGAYTDIIKACPNTAEAVKAYQEAAILCIQSKQLNEADVLIERLKAEYSAFPGTVDALHSVAQHWQRNGLPEQALRLFRYNSATYSATKKGMWSQGEIVNYYIAHKDFVNARKEYEVMLERFKDQPTLPQEIHQFAEKYRMTDENERAMELHRYNIANSPVSSMYTMWSQGAIVHYYISQNDFVAAQRECEVMINRFSDQPALPQELHLIAGKYKDAGQIDRFFDLHRYNMTHSPVSSKYTMWSQGALVHYFIEQKEFYKADYEYKELLIRFSDQPTLPEEIYQFAMKYDSVGETGKALELHRYNATQSPVDSLYAMQSQGAIVNYYIQHKDFVNARKEYEWMLGWFKDQPTWPQEIYQFALKYRGVGESEKALELHRYNATHSDVSSKYTMWSQGALVHYSIEHKDFVNAQKEYEWMLERFKDQPTWPQEICQFADKYQQYGNYEQSRNLCQYGLETYPGCAWRHDFQKVLIKTHLAENDYEQASSIATGLIEKSSERSAFVKTMTDLGHIYRDGRQWDQSIQYYQQALEKAELPEEQLDAYAGIAKSRIRLAADSVTPEEYSEINAIVKVILSTFKDCKNAGLLGIQIGEEYYYLGRESLETGMEKEAKNNFNLAIPIWEQVIYSDVSSEIRSECYYLIGSCYLKSGDYADAETAFQRSYQIDPGYKYADYCLFVQGYCLQKLMENEIPTTNDAFDKLKRIYSEFLTQFPASRYASYAKTWLGDFHQHTHN
jgi:tetratricopeptide (TPR) repeat protein